MPVRNGERYLREALDSVLSQTHGELEVVLVDDGSDDSTPAIVEGYEDRRVCLVRQPPSGLVAALGRGVAEARGDLIARMDADDVSLPHRLERQLELLERESGLGLVGCGVETIDERGRATGSWLLPAADDALRRRLLLRNLFTHGSVVMRRSALEAAGGYSGAYGANEDYDLWRRIARGWRLAAVPEVLYRYREHSAAVTKQDVAARVASRERLRDELWNDVALLRAVPGERDRTEARALAREALRRRRYRVALRALADAVRVP
jgi:glycosyltransferase involved in cell wall biosynthesis